MTPPLITTRKHFFALTLVFSVLFIGLFFLLPSHAHAEKLYEVLQSNAGPGKAIKDVWTSILQIVNVVVILALIFIAFANILRININTYGVKKFLPALIMAVLLANFSYFICRFMIDIANALMSLLINGSGGAGIAGTNGGLSSAFAKKIDPSQFVSGNGLNWSAIGAAMAFTIIEFAGTVIMFLLALMYYIRNYVIYFLVALAPLAFMAAVLPFTKTVFNMWWQNFWKWTLMPIVSLFWIWVGNKWIVPLMGGTSSIMAIVFAGVCYYLALTTPSKMGQGLMTSWNKLGKWGWNKTGGAAWKATGGAVGTTIKDSAKGYYDRQKGFVKEKIYATGIGKRIKDRQNAFKLKNEMPGMIRENADKVSRRLAALRELSKHDAQWWDQPKHKAIFSRLKSVFREGINEEGQNPRWKGMDVPQLAQEIPLNGQGNPLNPHDIATGNFHASVSVADRAKILADPVGALEKAGAAHTEMQRRARLSPNYADQPLADSYLRGLAGTARAGMNPIKRGGDPAFYGSSAVGETIEDVAEQAADEFGEAGREAVSLATQGRTGDLATLFKNGPIPVKVVEMSEAVAASRARALSEETDFGQKRIDDIINGIGMVHAGGGKLADVTANANTAEYFNNRGDIEQARGAIGKINGDLVPTIDAHTDQAGQHQAVREMISAIREGAKTLETSGKTDISGMSPEDFRKYQDEIRQKMLAAVPGRASEAATYRTAMDIAQPAQHVVDSLGESSISEALERHADVLTQHTNEIAKAAGGKIQLTPQATARVMSSSVASSGLDPRSSMVSALSDKTFQTTLARRMADATVMAQNKAPKISRDIAGKITNVTNINNTPPTPGRPPTPPLAPPKNPPLK